MASSARIEELEKKFNENPRRYFAPLAHEYRKAGETEQAIALCRAYLPQQPGHMSGHIVFGQALFDAGEIDEAQGVFETALGLDPENLIALRHLGDIAHSRGDIAGARSWYRRVLDADPRNEEIAAQLAALPDDGSAPALESTPAGEASSVGWGDINPERSEPAGDAVAAAGESVSKRSSEPAVASAEPAAAEALDIERASASSDDDIDIDALFTTTDAPREKPASSESAAVPLEGEKTAEVPVFEKGPAEEPTLEVELEPAAPGTPDAPKPAREEVKASSPAQEPADDLGLEVAEFVPPASTEPGERALGFETGHESVVGGPVGGTPGSSPAVAGTPAGFVTETMAELYLQQGFVQEALNVYRQLLEQDPEDAALRERIAQLEQGARSSVSMAAVSDEVVEAARKRQASPARRSMRQFLGSLAARRAPQRESAELVEADSPAETYEAGIAAESLEPEPQGAPYEADVAAGPDDDRAITDGLESQGPHAAAFEPFEPAEPEPLPRVSEPSRLPHVPEPADEEMPFARTSASASEDDGLDALFEGAGINPEDQAAAATLAGAFDSASIPAAPTGPRGRPTRAAPSELSLDNVFRESGGDAGLQRPRSDFSFDQFFSEEASASTSHANGDEGAPEPSAESPNPDDIGQFNDWLEGLKKK